MNFNAYFWKMCKNRILTFRIFFSYFLRSKNIEASSGNGDMAFQEVRIQQSVVEFILNHTDQIFSGGPMQIKPKEGMTFKKLQTK